jgi:excisionase family DNA binding protein
LLSKGASLKQKGQPAGMRESREVMNLRQASDYLGVSPDTLYRYICTGLVPAFKLGSRWKFRKSVLDRWMEEKMRQSQGRRA